MTDSPEGPARDAGLPGAWEPDRVARAILALGLAGLLGPLLAVDSRDIALTDDAYYYLLPAANFWSLGYYSFDGLTGTNGFHPLWMVLVTACALPLQVADALGGLPRAVLWLSVALTIWGGLAWFGVLRRAGATRTLAILIVFVTVVACQDLLLSGLESVVVFWSIGLLSAYLMGRIAEGLPVRPLAFAGYSLLVLFSRLDCGLFLLLLYAALVPFAGLRRIVTAGVLLTLLATPYLLMNVAWHGAATPISGRVKQHWGDRYELETTGRVFGLSWAQIQDGPGRARLRQITGTCLPRDLAPGFRALSLGRIDFTKDQAPWFPWALGGLVLVAGLRLGWASRRRMATTGWLMAALGATLAAYYMAGTVYYALSYDRVWPWYGTAGVMVLAASLAWITGGLLSFRGGLYVQGALVTVLFVYGFGANVQDARKAAQLEPQSLRAVYLDMAAWLEKNTAEGAVAAGWAVGEIGWYAQRPVINLEGLASNEALLEANRATDLLPILANYDVRHLCNFWRPALAPRPEDVLAPGAPIGAWKRDPVRYFWTLRLRPMMDCPEAFAVRYRHDAGDGQDTSGYVIGVDQAMIARYLEARAAWRAQMANIAHVVPAEDFTAIGGGKVEANIGRTEGYFVRGKSLTYTLGPLPVGDYAVYGRLCHLGAKNGSLKFSHAGETQTVAIHADPQWRHVRLDDIAMKAENASATFTLADMSNGVYLDQVYLVETDDSAEFENVPADWWLPPVSATSQPADAM